VISSFNQLLPSHDLLLLISQIPDNLMCHLTILASQLRMDLTTLINTLKISADIVADSDFVAQMLSINDGIAELSADN